MPRSCPSVIRFFVFAVLRIGDSYWHRLQVKLILVSSVELKKSDPCDPVRRFTQ